MTHEFYDGASLICTSGSVAGSSNGNKSWLQENLYFEKLFVFLVFTENMVTAIESIFCFFLS